MVNLHPKTAHLIPKDLSKMPNFKEISSKGGKVKSIARKQANIYTGMIMKAKNEGNNEKATILEAIRDKKLSEAALLNLAQVLFKTDLQQITDTRTGAILTLNTNERLQISKILASMLPQKSVNLHGIEGEITVRWVKPKELEKND